MAQEGGGAGAGGAGGGGMGGSGGGMDMSKLGMPQKIVGVCAAIFVIWVFIPGWWSVNLGPLGGATGGSGFFFPIILAWIAAIAAVVGVVFTAMGTKMPEMQIKPGMVQLILAGVGVVATLLGFVMKPGGGFGGVVGLGWAYFVGLILTLVWAYGAFMWSKEG